MEKVILSILTGIFCFFVGYGLGNRDTVSCEEYDEKVSEYESQISYYQDYIHGLDQFVSADTIDNNALQILRNKINIDE